MAPQVRFVGEGNVLQQHVVEETIWLHTRIVSAEPHGLAFRPQVHIVAKAIAPTVLQRFEHLLHGNMNITTRELNMSMRFACTNARALTFVTLYLVKYSVNV